MAYIYNISNLVNTCYLLYCGVHDMKDIASKYEKAWELFCKYWLDMHENENIELADIYNLPESIPIVSLFGYLVLEFFPKYGIRIRQKLSGDWAVEKWYKVDKRWWPADLFSKTPQEAIDKAFEILEKQLEE